MQYRTLGTTGIQVSAVALGAGPVSQLLTGDDRQAQCQTIAAAVEAGINWIDTAATYGHGASEENLGRTLAELHLADRVHVATKVRVMPEQLDAIGRTVRDSVHASLRRLRLPRVTLLQVHNAVTELAGAEPTSLTPAHVLEPGGMLEAMQRLVDQGLVAHLGLTGLGEPPAMRRVIESGAFATMQIPYNLLNPSAGCDMPSKLAVPNYGNLIATAAERGMGVFAIRVLAGGALAGRSPSPHTLKTPFFPIELYERDCRQADALPERLPPGMTREEAAVRFSLSHPHVTSAIVGLATPAEVGASARYAEAGPLDAALLARLKVDR